MVARQRGVESSATAIRRGISRRDFLYRAGVVAAGTGPLMGVLAACGGGTSKTASSNEPFRMGEEVQAFTRNFNPFAPQPRSATHLAMFEPMMIFNSATKKIVPWLATGYQWSGDNLALTFKIRDGVKWSDGQKFSGDDVAFTFDLMRRNQGLLGQASTAWSQYLSAVDSSGSSVKFSFRRPYTPALYDLAQQTIVPQHQWSGVGNPVTFTNPNPVATGPFTDITRFETQLYQVAKNKSYWQKGKPYIPMIQYTAYTGNEQLTRALVSDEIDYGGGYVPNITKIYVDKDKDHHHFWWPLILDIYLVVNTTKPPFDQPDVRKAIGAALDRNKMVQTALQGYTKPANATGLAPYMYEDWIDPSIESQGSWWVSHNVARANQTLDAAGYKRGSNGVRTMPNGAPMSFQLTVPGPYTDWVSDVEVIASNLKDIGIQANVFTPAVDQWTSNVYSGRFDMAINIGDFGATPFEFYRGMMSSQTYTPVGQTSTDNVGRYRNAQADQILDKWVQTSDESTWKTLCKQLQQIFVDEAPAIPIYGQPLWGSDNSLHFTGFPSPSDAYAPLGAASGATQFVTSLIVLTTVKPA